MCSGSKPATLAPWRAPRSPGRVASQAAQGL
jgi:hypothetical protein